MVAIGMFTLGISVIQILVTVAVFTGYEEWGKVKITGDKPEGITSQLYIVLSVMDFVIIIFSIVFLYGNERTNEIKARNYYLPWVIIIPFYVIYESAINIYYFYNQFNTVYQEEPLSKGYPLGFILVPLIYWAIKTIILIICFVFVIMRIQSLMPDVVSYDQQPIQIDGCHDCYSGPTMHVPSPAPPSLPPCTTCSGGACAGNRCSACDHAQPMYGFAGPQTSNVQKSGWTTTVYNSAGR
jgi:hypothetical protein